MLSATLLVTPSASPAYGLLKATVPSAVTHAAVSILPSSAMLTTPPRSLKNPPTAARTSGALRAIVFLASNKPMGSLMGFDLPIAYRRVVENQETENHVRDALRHAQDLNVP